VLIRTRNENVILDAGLGLYKIHSLITNDKPIYLFISHYHLDHIFGVHTLPLFDFRQGIQVYGPSGIKKYFGGLIRGPYTLPLGKLRTKVCLNDLAAGKRPPFDLEFRKLRHPALCYGYRFKLEGKVVTYCTDTGMNGNIVRLAKGADLFISECSLKPGQQQKSWGHMNPELAGSAAKEAGAKKLVLTHFAADIYTGKKDRAVALTAARRVFKRTTVACDGMMIEL
jgi:Metal-dependent hydrolases of the beta-lactamase superfamily III